MSLLDKIKEALSQKPTEDYWKRNVGKKIEAKILGPQAENEAPEYQNVETNTPTP